LRYLLEHWEGLTLFLRQAGAPLDNNLCEQILKRAIVHRKRRCSARRLPAPRSGTSTWA
jgi:hypothetical protein